MANYKLNCMKKHTLVTLFVLLFFCYQASAITKELGGITGKIVSTSQKYPVVGLTIRANVESCKCDQCKKPRKCKCCVNGRTVTNSSGRFRITGLKSGTYTIKVEFDDYTIVVANGVIVKNGKVTEIGEIKI